MAIVETLEWIRRSRRRTKSMLHLKQPLTVLQLARLSELPKGTCSRTLWELRVYKLALCLNQFASKCRVYWLTSGGKTCQDRIRAEWGYPPLAHDFPVVDWELFGFVSTRHRAAVLKAMDGPLQPATIRRRARLADQSLRMSANNCRDVVKFFTKMGIARSVQIRGKAHQRFVVTETGRDLQELLRRAETREYPSSHGAHARCAR